MGVLSSRCRVPFFPCAELAAAAALSAGAAAAAMTATGHRLYYHLEQIEHEESLAAMREVIGQDAFEKAWAEGQVMALKEAMALVRTRMSGRDRLARHC
jgi:hypothetical protein